MKFSLIIDLDRLSFITFKLQEKDDEFISLFNGKTNSLEYNRTGFHKKTVSLIQPKRGQKGWQRYSDYLISKEKFGDFILKLEYKYPPKGNAFLYFSRWRP